MNRHKTLYEAETSIDGITTSATMTGCMPKSGDEDKVWGEWHEDSCYECGSFMGDKKEIEIKRPETDELLQLINNFVKLSGPEYECGCEYSHIYSCYTMEWKRAYEALKEEMKKFEKK